MSGEAKLDIALSFLRTNLQPCLKEQIIEDLVKQGIDYSEPNAIINKLVKDGFLDVIENVQKIPDEYLEEWHLFTTTFMVLSFEGRMFIANGGYVWKKRKENTALIAQWIISIGMVIATSTLAWFEFWKYHYYIPCK